MGYINPGGTQGVKGRVLLVLLYDSNSKRECWGGGFVPQVVFAPRGGAVIVLHVVPSNAPKSQPNLNPGQDNTRRTDDTGGHSTRTPIFFRTIHKILQTPLYSL